MIKQIIPVLLLVCYAFASTPFIGEGNRTEFFELTDNKIVSFNITIPDEHLKELKEKVQFYSGYDQVTVMENTLNLIKGDFSKVLNIPEPEEYKTKEASLAVEINGEKKSFKKVTLAIGGSSARSFGRQGFNIKIRGKDDLFGVSQFRLRPDAHEATYLRSKIACDIHNRLGLTSISANYITLYVNGEYLGLYVVMDSPKLPWIERRYGEKDTPNLYICKQGGISLTVQSSAEVCENENDEVTDRTEWIEFLTALDNAKTAKDIEDIFEIDHFLYEMAYEYLSGTWDRFLCSGHNFSMYKQKTNGKWIFLSYDYDADFGQDPSNIQFGLSDFNPNRDFVNYSFGEWASKRHHILNLLIFDDPTRFINILKKFVEDAFNPAILFPRIDELKKLIRPSIVKDKTPDENGNAPGFINKKTSNHEYTVEEWDANSEFTSLSDGEITSSYGLKYWILYRYRNVCKRYNIECDPVYMDEDYEYPVDKKIEGELVLGMWDSTDFTLFGFGGYRTDDIVIPEEPTETQTTISPTEVSETTVVETQPTEVTETQPTEVSDVPSIKCLAEIIGYPCCDKKIKTVYDHDEYGDWGYDFKKKEWCGITPYSESVNEEECWSETLGYPCCRGCYVFVSDEDGEWGFENNHWCGIQSFCKA